MRRARFLPLVLALLLALSVDICLYAQSTGRRDTIKNTIYAQANANPGDVVNGRFIWQADIDWARRRLGLTGEPVRPPPESAVSAAAAEAADAGPGEEPAPAVSLAASADADAAEEHESKPKKSKRPRKPLHYKYFEVGFDAEAGFSNSYLVAADLFKKTIEIDLNSFAENNSGFSLYAGALVKPFFNVYINNNWGFGIRGGVDFDINGNVPQSFMELISRGNRLHHRVDGDVSVSGGVFASGELTVWGKIKGIKGGISPAFYIPVAYIPKSMITYEIDSHTGIAVSAEAYANVYTPISIENGMNELNELNMDTINSIIAQGGVDISLFAEYPFLKNLDAGIQLTRIPLAPARLTNRMLVDDVVITVDGKNLIDVIDQDIDVTFNPKYETGSYPVLRPFRFDLYAVWRPFTSSIISLRPHLGLSFITADKVPHINGGLRGEVNLARILMLRLALGHDETVWKHSLNLELNLRILDFYAEARFISQDFINSFRGGGLGAAAGIKIGF
ncbi:MAG: hypothetical protein LBG74_05345 [Spirochaetaceae bacterium]|jgi:hypothetical protein|nr:hypothetical protein [Spirochaetaceae bacterium]